jgi:hypothetical protein
VETLAEVGDVDGQGQIAARPQRENPTQQGSKTGGDVEFLAFGTDSRLRVGREVKLAEAFSQGWKRVAEQLAQNQDDGAETTALGSNHAEGIQGQRGNDGGGQIGKTPLEFALPTGKLWWVRQGNTPRSWVRSIPKLADFSVAPIFFLTFAPTSNHTLIFLLTQ